MKDLLFYIFYKASKFYKSFGERYYYISGGFVLLLTLCSIILSLLELLCSILNIRFKVEATVVVWLLFVLFGFLIPWEKKYKELEEKYKNEDKRKWKGWLVVLYIVFSLILYIVASGISVRFESGR